MHLIGTLTLKICSKIPMSILNYERLLRTALGEAKADGLFPRVGEVYRTPERSQSLHDTIKGPAAAAWHSAHNYGLAIDVYLYDANGKRIDYDNRAQHPDWYRQVKDFADKYMGPICLGSKK